MKYSYQITEYCHRFLEMYIEPEMFVSMRRPGMETTQSFCAGWQETQERCMRLISSRRQWHIQQRD